MNALRNCVKIRGSRGFSSALYITGDKAQSNFAAVSPHLDFEQRLQDKNLLLENIRARNSNLDLDKIEKRWNFFNVINDHKTVLELTRNELTKQLTELRGKSDQNTEEIDKLTAHLKFVRDDLKNVKDFLYGVEENAALGALSLPNCLHPRTPVDTDLVLHTAKDCPSGVSSSHVTIGSMRGLLHLHDEYTCFLTSDASRFEFAVLNHFREFYAGCDYNHVSNADFATSVVLEGCGRQYLDPSCLTLSSEPSLNKLHLVGGASLYSFMAYFAKNLVQAGVLPLLLCTQGRVYNAVDEYSERSLLNLVQSSAGRVFIVSDDDTDTAFDLLLKQTVSFYETLNYHFRVCYAAACNLQPAESLRVSIEMYSNYSQAYIQVGYLSVYDRYLSKRLLFSCSTNKERKFLKVISGEVVNVHKMLGCVLENEGDLLPEVLRGYI